jgi:hypothetical protein
MQVYNVYRKQLICWLMALTGFLMNAKAATEFLPGDSLAGYREIAQIWKLYQQKPVQLTVVIHHATTPLLKPADSSRSELSLYLDEHNYYLSADGLEMILNDSFSLMVNHPGRRMILYETRQPFNQQLLGPLRAFAADSSIQMLARKYQASQEMLAGEQELFRLTSREQVTGTNIPMETVWLIRKTGSVDPVAYGTKHTKLLPVDSVVWAGWQKEAAYAGKLVRMPAPGNRWMYFLAREETTVYEFSAISHRAQRPPVALTDRLQQDAGGQYAPVKEYAAYLFTKE